MNKPSPVIGIQVRELPGPTCPVIDDLVLRLSIDVKDYWSKSYNQLPHLIRLANTQLRECAEERMAVIQHHENQIAALQEYVEWLEGKMKAAKEALDISGGAV